MLRGSKQGGFKFCRHYSPPWSGSGPYLDEPSPVIPNLSRGRPCPCLPSQILVLLTTLRLASRCTRIRPRCKKNPYLLALGCILLFFPIDRIYSILARPFASRLSWATSECNLTSWSCRVRRLSYEASHGGGPLYARLAQEERRGRASTPQKVQLQPVLALAI